MIELTPWPEFKTRFRWNQGEHVGIIGPTGAGKTTLQTELMPYRKANLMFGTKVADPQYDLLLKRGFKRVESMSEVRPWDYNVILWPKYKGSIPQLVLKQRAVFAEAMDTIVSQKRWTVWIDEAKYTSQFLGLGKELEFCVEQLRSLKATVICGAQRPAWIPKSILSNASHVFIWKTTNRDDALRLADIGGVDVDEVRQEARTLGPFEFLYIRTRGTVSKILRTQVER